MASSIGAIFRVTTWGESHGPGVGAVIDGCPPRLPLVPEEIERHLLRRRPGQSGLTTRRDEEERVEILSGVFEERTLGSPILLLVRNADADPSSYEPLKDLFRPSHADFTYQAKYGIRDWRGGGRASARETVGRVAAAAVAEKLLRVACGIEIVGWAAQIADVIADVDPEHVTREQVDAHPTRCPSPGVAARMAERIEAARRDGDSVGGVVGLVARNVPAGLGEPVFDKLEADLARAMLSIPAANGFEIGSGFGAAHLLGSQNNDPFWVEEGAGDGGRDEGHLAGGGSGAGGPGDRGHGPVGRIRTRTNRSGGVQGGISNGESVLLRIAFKPPASIGKEQQTVDLQGRPRTIAVKGRHDPCVIPRAVPIVESMAALVLADHWLRQLALSEAAERIDGALT